MLQTNPLPRTRKGVNRQFRKWLTRNGYVCGRDYPATGAFALTIGGKEIVTPEDLPAKVGRLRVETFPGVEPGNLAPPVKVKQSKPKAQPKPAPATVEALPDRTLYKRIVREADPLKPGSKRRTDYRVAKNPKPDDGVQYFAKVDGKWREVPASYADPLTSLADAA